MTVEIFPGKAKGAVCAPPSKSMAHRLLIAAGLSRGTSTVTGLSLSQDISATMDCLQALGASIEYADGVARITGCDVRPADEGTLLPCRESGSTLRFFIPLCLLSSHSRILTGSPRLMERPQTVYEALCKAQNLPFHRQADRVTLRGPLQGGDLTVAGNISSQFVTGLTFALPLTGQNSTITLTEPIESRSYIDLTLQALESFGIPAHWEGTNRLVIPAGQYQPADTTVEGDYSNAAFLDALNLLGGRVSVTGLQENSRQGDRVYRQAFQQLLTGNPVISLADCPDLGPILMALAAALQGAVFTHTARLRIKESDRGQAMAQELRKFGITVEVNDNTVRVHAGSLHPPVEPLCGHNDHRIVMALATLCTLTGGRITDAQAVAKSYPDYFRDIAALGISFKEV